MLLATWQTWPGAIVAAVVLGIGFGAYTLYAVAAVIGLAGALGVRFIRSMP